MHNPVLKLKVNFSYTPFLTLKQVKLLTNLPTKTGIFKIVKSGSVVKVENKIHKPCGVLLMLTCLVGIASSDDSFLGPNLIRKIEGACPNGHVRARYDNGRKMCWIPHTSLRSWTSFFEVGWFGGQFSCQRFLTGRNDSKVSVRVTRL